MTGQFALVPDDNRFVEAMLAPSTMIFEILIRPPEFATLIAALPAQPSRDHVQPQRTFWLLDPHPARPKRTKPESLGIEPLAENEESYRLELELRDGHLPVVTELPDRADCRGGHRPCPLVSCAHNNYVSRTPGGAAKLTFPHLEPWEVPKSLSCSLDIADKGATVKTVGKALNLTEERIRQIQVGAFKKLRSTRLGREWLRGMRGG